MPIPEIIKNVPRNLFPHFQGSKVCGIVIYRTTPLMSRRMGCFWTDTQTSWKSRCSGRDGSSIQGNVNAVCSTLKRSRKRVVMSLKVCQVDWIGKISDHRRGFGGKTDWQPLMLFRPPHHHHHLPLCPFVMYFLARNAAHRATAPLAVGRTFNETRIANYFYSHSLAITSIWREIKGQYVHSGGQVR